MRRTIAMLFILSALASGLQGCAALVGGASGAAVYGAAEQADQDQESNSN